MPSVLEKLRMPLGPFFVDVGLVIYLAFSAGQMTKQFDTMDRRLAAVELRTSTERLAERTALLEQRAAQYDRDRSEILEALHRIETKIDGKVDKP